MGIYRKKPVEIEARQWLGTNADEMHAFIGAAMSWHPIDKSLRIHTAEGIMLANGGDWIIKGIKGEFYPCKPDIFQATYDPVDLLSELPEDTSKGPWHTPGHSFPCPACQPEQSPIRENARDSQG